MRNLVRHISSLRVLILAVSAVLFISGCSEPPYTNIDNDKLKLLLAEGVPLYDIRRPEEWRDTGIVAGSQKLTFVNKKGQLNPQFFDQFLAAQKSDQPVIVICRTGNRSGVLGTHLVEKLGFTKLYNVEHGITQWIREGNPTTRK
ncbi:MAG: sulfurtransferase [Magnetococcales bacterium]|nr:sulfurtransferase [Magnetococcales bacterium]